jgi:hypothetical protein
LLEVEEFVDFLAAKTGRLAAMDRLLAIAPAHVHQYRIT